MRAFPCRTPTKHISSWNSAGFNSPFCNKANYTLELKINSVKVTQWVSLYPHKWLHLFKCAARSHLVRAVLAILSLFTTFFLNQQVLLTFFLSLSANTDARACADRPRFFFKCIVQRVSSSNTPSLWCIYRYPQCRWIVGGKRKKKRSERRRSRSQIHLLKENLVCVQVGSCLLLFWELSHARTHITSRIAAHSTSFTINSLVALKCYFIKLLCKEKKSCFEVLASSTEIICEEEWIT